MANFKDALDLTTGAIERRARNYRNLVVLVVLIFLGCGVWAVIQFSALPLLAWLLLLPFCGAFFFLDALLVNRWCDRILRMWAREELDLDTFVQSVASIRVLPPRTLGGMVGTLPTVARVKLSPVMKQAIASAVITSHRCETDRTAAWALAYTCAAAAVAVAVMETSWIPLAGIVLVTPVLAGLCYLHAARWGSWRRAVLSMQQELEVVDFFRVADQLKLAGIPRKTRRQLLVS